MYKTTTEAVHLGVNEESCTCAQGQKKETEQGNERMMRGDKLRQ